MGIGGERKIFMVQTLSFSKHNPVKMPLPQLPLHSPPPPPPPALTLNLNEAKFGSRCVYPSAVLQRCNSRSVRALPWNKSLTVNFK